MEPMGCFTGNGCALSTNTLDGAGEWELASSSAVGPKRNVERTVGHTLRRYTVNSPVGRSQMRCLHDGPKKHILMHDA